MYLHISVCVFVYRIVQEIDSVEYGLTDIQEYYANTGALKVRIRVVVNVI
jgi:cobalamin biosynthesis Mg chelatase CobN